MDNDDDSEASSSGVSGLEQAKSYLAYALLALRRHSRRALVCALACVVLTVGAVAIWPRTYTCVTILAVQENRVLDREGASQVWAGAEEVILSHDNVGRIVDEIELPRRWLASLPPAQRFKQRAMALVRGEISERDKRDSLIAMAQLAIRVTPPAWGQQRLTISADWYDAKIASDLAGAALESFLRARHVAEIATITEYITILEGHANELRDEIQKFVGESQSGRDKKLSQIQAATQPAVEPPAPTARRVAQAPAPPKKEEPSVDLGELKAELEQKQANLKQLEDERQRRLDESEGALRNLRSQFTEAHPLVIAAEANMKSLAADTSRVAGLRAEVLSLTAKLKSKTAAQALAAEGGPRVSSVPSTAGLPGASSVEPLPAEIMRLMQDDNEEMDPAVGAQFRGAVAKYATIRDKIGTARVDLDTAQVAFKHRYQTVIPAEPPSKPSKPRVPLLLAAGIAVSLLVGFLATIVAELKRGRVVERWQVYRLGVPVLAELRWPPTSDD